MANFDWSQVSDFERFPKLESVKKVGSEAKITFQDDGTFVSEKQLKEAKAKHPRDSIVFVVMENNEKKEFWVASESYSVVKQLKRVREKNGGTLKGAVVKIKRVSDQTNETNYEIKEV